MLTTWVKTLYRSTIAKQQLCTCITLFCIFFFTVVVLLRRMPNFKFCGGREHNITTFFGFFCTSKKSFRIQLQKNIPNIWIGHFRVPKTLTFKMGLGAQPFLCKWVLFAREWIMISHQRLSTYPRFETEALGNSEMTYWTRWNKRDKRRLFS